MDARVQPEEKRKCDSCGARLRPGARFCSACGAIIRVNQTPKASEPVVQQVNTPVENNQNSNLENNKKEFVYNEKVSKKAKGPKKEKQPKAPKEGKSFELAGGNTILWNCLTAITSVLFVVLGIILLSSNFVKVVFEGYPMSLSMGDCLGVLTNSDIPIFYEITTEIVGMCSAIGVVGIMFLVVSILYLGYNLVMYGKYNKTLMLINTAFSSVLTVFAVMLMIFQVVLMNKCKAAGVSESTFSMAIIVLIVSVVLLAMDALKLTVLYQKKMEAKDNPSYVLNFLSTLGKNIWKYLSIGGGVAAAIVILIIVLIATSKAPTIKLWEEFVDAYNKENVSDVVECYYPLDTEEAKAMKANYETLFAAQDVKLGKGKAQLLINTEKYVKLGITDVKYTSNGTEQKCTLTVHFGKVDGTWYLMSEVDALKAGNVVELNDFNQEVSETILKINEGTVRGFSLKISKKDANKITTLVIPEGVKKIEKNAFIGLENLKTVVIADSVEIIETGAFANCAKLENLVLGKSLATIEANSFDGTIITKVVLPESVKYIGSNAFNTTLTEGAVTEIYTHYNETPEGFQEDWCSEGCKVYLDKQWNHEETPDRINLLTVYSNGGDYELEDDEYFETGDVVKLPVPTKKGCEFLGWYTTADFKENSKIKTDEIEISGDIAIYAKWNENIYNIKYNLDGGTLDNMTTTYKVNDLVTLGTPVKPGYTFVGWIGEGITEPVEVVEFQNETGDREYTAVYKANIYTITLVANNGTTTKKEVKVSFGDNYRLSITDFSYKGMKAIGWNTEADGSGTNYKTTQEIAYTFTEDITLYLIWSSVITLDANGGKLQGEAPRIVPGTKNYKIEVPTTHDYVFFDGWYTEDGTVKITNELGEGLKEWNFDSEVTLTAKWVEKRIVDGITYVYSGFYPQTRVTNTETLSALGKISTTNARGYIEFEGEEYAKVVYNNAKEGAKFNDGVALKYKGTYYFLVEKILWRVLDDKEMIAVSEYIIDAIQYYESTEMREEYNADAELVDVYPNNFRYSTINSWLNCAAETKYEDSGFALNIFESEKELFNNVQMTLGIDNSLDSTLAADGMYIVGNTDGYFYPLSHKEYKETYAEKLKDKVIATDYAIAKEVVSTKWWLRSPATTKNNALAVMANGAVDVNVVTDYLGVRPAADLK